MIHKVTMMSCAPAISKACRKPCTPQKVDDLTCACIACRQNHQVSTAQVHPHDIRASQQPRSSLFGSFAEIRPGVGARECEPRTEHGIYDPPALHTSTLRLLRRK